MATVQPFCAFRPPSDRVRDVASPPYDVVNTEQARALASGNPASFLHVTRAEIDLPVGTDEHADEVHIRGRDNLRKLVEDRHLVADTTPSLYIYSQKMGDHEQVGIVGCASVDEYERDLVKKHEKTRPDKEDDRTKHIDTLSAHDEPVFLTYRAKASIDALVASVTAGDPTYDFVTDDEVAHRLWIAPSEVRDQLVAEFAQNVPALYVADGHHRSAAAARVHRLNRGDGREHDVFLAVVFPHDQMNIMAYNRVVIDPDGRDVPTLLAALKERLDLTEATSANPEKSGTFGLYLGGHWYRATPRAAAAADDVVAGLDCQICQDQILAPLFGITDPRTSKSVDFVGGIHGPDELKRRVDDGKAHLGIALFPTQMTEVMAVSDADKVMPPKSTWFEPKLRSGLFVHTF